MAVFHDKQGRSWNVEITMETAFRLAKMDFSKVCERESVNLMKFDEQLIADLVQDAGLCVAVLFAICKQQAREVFNVPVGNVTPEGYDLLEMKFLGCFDGDTIAVAQKALLEAVANFFPGKKMFILNAFERAQEAEKIFMDRVEAKSADLQKVMEEKADQVIAKMMAEFDAMTKDGGDF